MKIIYFREVKKMLKKRKKILILSSMALLLIVTGFLNYKLSNAPTKSVGANTANTSFFATYKEDRTASRQSQLELLNEIIESSYSTAAEKETAVASKTELASKMEKELILEGLIKAKGFEDAVVTIGSNYYNVIVKSAETLTDERANQILSILKAETGASARNVKIIPIE